MQSRIRCVTLAALMLSLACGCDELTQTITVNPDGRGKMTFDLTMPVGSPTDSEKPGKEKSLAEKKRQAVEQMLSRSVTWAAAWKDVTAKWSADGRLHVTGTAYFEKFNSVEWYSKESKLENYKLTLDKDGGMKITFTKETKGPPKIDPATMREAELDEYILSKRVQYQTTKPLVTVVFSDMKHHTTIRLPGKPQDVQGFRLKGDGTLVREIDGNAIVAQTRKFMGQDNAALQKVLKGPGGVQTLESMGMENLLPDCQAVVAKPGAALFDFDKEVKEAREAYSTLRKNLQLGEKVKLPGE